MLEPNRQTKEPKINLEKYKLCPACGNFSNVNEKQIYCIACGEKLIEECTSCKEVIVYPTAKYCHKCGEGYKKENQTNSNQININNNK